MLLENAQNLRLDGGAHVADFIQEQAAPVGLFEPSDALAVRAGERALLVPEQLGLEQRFRKRRAVHLHEIPGRAQ